MRHPATGLILLALAGTAAAQDQQLGARAKAMGGSYTAFEDDPVLVWLNPAGIATQPDLVAVVYQTYTAYTRGRERGPGDTTVFTVEPEITLSDPPFWPSYLGVVFQVGEGDLAIGVCFAQPYLLNFSLDQVTDPAQTAFVPEAEVRQSFPRFRVAAATDFALRERGQPGFLGHVSVGLGLDVGTEHWEFNSPSAEESDSSSGLGWGLGLLVQLYDDGDSFRLNLGAAYQSAIEYDFEIEPDILPAFDMPQQLNAGLTAYVLPGTPLRLTFDLQWIEWSETAEDPFFPGFEKFDDALSYSLGAEVRLPVSARVTLYPRAGFRRFDAPWTDEDNLPMTGGYRLVLDTDDEVFNLFTFGLGIGWSSAGGKLRTVDVGADVGGDAVNVAAGVTFEF